MFFSRTTKSVSQSDRCFPSTQKAGGKVLTNFLEFTLPGLKPVTRRAASADWRTLMQSAVESSQQYQYSLCARIMQKKLAGR